MKINVDAALPKKNTRRATVVAIARDGEVTFLGASALVQEGLSEAWLKHLHVVKASLSRLT
jgi:hypothetical protein